MSAVFSRRRMVGNASWIMFSGVTASLLSFLASVFVARNYPVTDYGVLQLAITYFMFAQLLEHFVHQSVVRIEIVKEHVSADRIVVACAQIIFLMYVPLLIAFGIAYLVTKSDLLLLVGVLTLGQLFRLSAGAAYYFDTILEAKKTQIGLMAGNLVASLYRIVASIRGPIFLQAFYVLIGNITTMWITFRYYRGRVSAGAWLKLDRELIRDMLKKSAPMFVISAVSMVVFKLDILLLGYFQLTKEISYYSNAVKLVEPWNFISWAIVNSILPNIIASRKRSLRAYYSEFRLLFNVLFYSAFLLGLVTTVFAEQIVALTYGPAYQASVPILRIHIWGNIFLFFMNGAQIWEINESLKRLLLGKLVAGSILNLVLNLILIPQYGGLGCAIASVVTYFAVAFGFNFFHRKARFFSMQILKGILDLGALKHGSMVVVQKVRSRLKR